MPATPRDCRLCGANLETVFVDLGETPLSNSYLSEAAISKPEPSFPLCVYVCDQCLLVQLPAWERPEKIFSDYAYFSSFSDSWLAHSKSFCGQMVAGMGLGPDSLVVEIASNDGYLLQYFVQAGIPVLGIEPAANVARAAESKGISTRCEFFGSASAERLAAQGERADLLIANNVIAHVPDLNDFVSGMQKILRPGGRITIEFPHIKNMIEEVQFDTIYHEHFSYFSLNTIEHALGKHRLKVIDVEKLKTHGGSLRVHATHVGNDAVVESPRVSNLRDEERAAGLTRIDAYRGFQQSVLKIRDQFVAFLEKTRNEGKRIAGYGAPAKGNTLLNFCGIGPDLIEFTVDRNPEKQGKFLPGSHIPVFGPEAVESRRPDYLVIFPWNIKDEIISQMQDIRNWNGRFVIPLPTLQVF